MLVAKIMKKNKAMTLIEIIVVVIIVGILATMVVVNFRGAIVGAHERDARASLVLVQQAEHTNFLETRQFVSCSDAATTCNQALHLSLPARSYQYSVVAANDPDPALSTFTAQADPVAGSDAANVGAHSFHVGTNDPNACLVTVALPCPAN